MKLYGFLVQVSCAELLVVSLFKMEPLAYKKMDFEEFCAAALNVYQLEVS